MIAIGRLCAGLALAAACPMAVYAQPAPQSDSEFRITAWAPKPLELPAYVGVNRPHWKLAELVAAHGNDKDWSQTLVEDRHLVASYVSMAAAGRTPRRLHPDTPIFWVVERGQIRFTIEGQPPFVASKGFLVQVPYRTPYELETVGDEPSLRLEVAVAGASTLYPLDVKPVPVPGKQFVEVTMPGRGKYDEINRPYLDFPTDVFAARAVRASSCATIT
jgi:quercetin dioxygenase-like cupin family protein